MIWEFILLTTSLLLIFTRINSTIKDKKKIWLNGPIHLPFIGGGLSIVPLSIATSFNEIFSRICSKYGSFCGVFTGQNYFVFVSDPKIAKKILNSEEIASRFSPHSWASNLYGGPNLGIIHSYGKQAKIVRDPLIAKLKLYGWGRGQWMDSLVQEQTDMFLKNWDEKIKGRKSYISMKGAFTMTVLNITFKILTGDTIKDEEKMLEFVNKADYIFSENAKSVALLFAFPFLRFIPFLTIYKEAQVVWSELKILFQEIIQRKRAEGKYKQTPTDVIESFIYDQENNFNTFSDEQIIWICVDLFMAGLLSLTANHLEWAVLFITSSSNSEVYRNVIKEIDQVIGHNRVPQSQDRSKMPYMEAFLLETLRLGNVVNFGMRCPLKDVEIEGYHIPKNTQVIIENACLKVDSEVWGDAKNFLPERFLNSNMDIVNVEKLKAFGIRRTCLGEAINKSISFIMFTSLLQRYTLKRALVSADISFNSASGIIGRPQHYFIQAEPREN